MDVNERLYQQRVGTRQDKNEYAGRDGLDTSLGSAALYTRTPAWHGLGTVVPEGTTDMDLVLKLGHIDFTVRQEPARFVTPDGVLRTVEGQFVTYRDDTNAGLGVVGRTYAPIQNASAYQFLADLTERGLIRVDSAGALRGGRKVFISLEMPDRLRIDGTGDEVRQFVTAINTHDGSGLFKVVVTPWMVVCGNTERFALRDAWTSWGVRHTAGAAERVAEAQRTLRLAGTYYTAWKAEEEALARTDLAIADFEALVADLWPVGNDSKRARTNADERMGRLRYLLDESPTVRGKGTAYAAERAVTEYLDYVAPLRPRGSLREDLAAARGAALIEGTADDRKARAHTWLMTRTGARERA